MLLVFAAQTQYALADTAQEFAEADSKLAAAWHDQNLEEALPWARKRVEIMAAQDRSSPQLLTPLLHLAMVELQLGKSAAALETIEHAESILGKQGGDMMRLEFLMLKAQVFADRDDDAEAYDIYARAVRVNKRLKPYDLSREAMIFDAYLEVAKQYQRKRKGDYAADRGLAAREKLYGEDSIELIAGLEIYARWCNFSSQLGDEREVRKRIIRILEVHRGLRDPQIAEQAILIAKGYLHDKIEDNDAAQLMEQALAVDFPNTKEVYLLQIEALATSGDIQMVFGSGEEGINYYRQAWKLLAENPDFGPDEANHYFRRASRIYHNWPDRPARLKRGLAHFADGKVEVEFDVLANGHLGSFKIVKSTVSNLDRAAFHRLADKARYRPRLVNGEPVITTGLKTAKLYETQRRN
ncbi:MAG: energy transducer TonB [Gammaproteobacteria bacterium]|jgi:tetratricopeptide (TPR) repeat protein|nr:energy transducer TonB [Gammaproteobacteria bacterium]